MKGSTAGGILDENVAAATNTLVYNKIRYNLASVQIAKSTHTAWVLPITAQPENKEDMIFIFSTPTKHDIPILMIVVPIVRTGAPQTDPLYLTALDVSNNVQNKTFSLEDCIPKNDYIKYTTCLTGYSTEASSANVIVFVNTAGLSVSRTLIEAILKKVFTAATFPVATADFMTKFSTTTSSVTAADIGNRVSITSPFINYVPPSNAPPSTDNYKCMPLDMAQIQRSDLSGAKTLTQVLLPDRKDSKILDPGKLERGISIALGIVMGILFFSVGIYILWKFIEGAKATAAGTAVPTVTIFSKLYSLWPFLLVLIVGISTGVVITVLTSKK